MECSCVSFRCSPCAIVLLDRWRMKILLLTSEFDPFRGGIGTYARELAVAAVENGHEVHLVGPDYGKDNVDLDRSFPFKVTRYAGGAHTMRDLPAKVRLVRDLCKDNASYDVVHAVDWPFYIPLALSGFKGKVKCLVTFHGTEITYMRHWMRSAVLSLVGFWGEWVEYITNSRFTTSVLQKVFPQSASGITKTIGLGVRDSWRKGRVERGSARTKLGFPSEAFVLVSLGRVVKRKGHLILAQALSLLPQEVQERIHWVIVGPHTDQLFVQELQESFSQTAATVTLAGPLSEDDVKLRLSAADLFCLPGYWDDNGQVEGFGLAFLEAAAFGLPSLATNVGGIPDAVIDGETGILVEPKNPEAVAVELLSLYRDRSRLAQLAAAADKHAKLESWRKVAQLTYG